MRSNHPLPAMSADQRRVYKRIRGKGAGRDDSIRAALAYRGPGPDIKARICKCCGVAFRTRVPSDVGNYCSNACKFIGRRRTEKARGLPATEPLREMETRPGVSESAGSRLEGCME